MIRQLHNVRRCWDLVEQRHGKRCNDYDDDDDDDDDDVCDIEIGSSLRKRGDLIECYKILTGKEHVDPLQFLHISDIKYDLRGHSLKLVANRSRLNIRQNFFSQRVVRSWNCLPQNVIDAPSVNSFKNRLDKFWKSAGYGL